MCVKLINNKMACKRKPCYLFYFTFRCRFNDSVIQQFSHSWETNKSMGNASSRLVTPGLQLTKSEWKEGEINQCLFRMVPGVTELKQMWGDQLFPPDRRRDSQVHLKQETKLSLCLRAFPHDARWCCAPSSTAHPKDGRHKRTQHIFLID